MPDTLSRKGLNTGNLVFTKWREGLMKQVRGWTPGVIPERIQNGPLGEQLPKAAVQGFFRASSTQEHALHGQVMESNYFS